MKGSDEIDRNDLAEFALLMAECYPEHAYYCTNAVVQQLWEVLTERLPGFARRKEWPGVYEMYTADSGMYHHELTQQTYYLRTEGWRFKRGWLARLPTEDPTAWDFSLFGHREEPWFLLRAWVFYLGQS